MTRGLSAAAVLLALCGTAYAGPFLAENISPNPDTLVPFDPDNPGAADRNSPIATLAGNFIRGMDFDTPTTGWYVATDDIGGSPIGFFRYDNGVSTFVAPLPFTSGTEGGLTLDRNNTFLYWVADPPVGDDEIWRIDFDGTFTFLADLSLAGVSSLSILGIAEDPATGILYAVEATSDQLVTIDPATGVMTPVGPLNQAVGGVGALDFDNADGSLILAGNSSTTDIFRVDITTGNAVLLGELTFGTSGIASIAESGGPACAADFNNDNSTNASDITAFLTAWFDDRATGTTNADFNNSGAVDASDITAFLTAWFEDRASGDCN